MDIQKNDAEYLKELLKHVKIKDIMRTPVVTVNENDDLSEAEEKFIQNGIYYLPVVDGKQRLVGVISQKYIYKTQSPRKIFGEEMEYRSDIIIDGDSFYSKEVLDSFILSKLMKKNPFTLTPENSIAEAILGMKKNHTGCIPIVQKDGRIAGILTNSDIVDVAAKILQS